MTRKKQYIVKLTEEERQLLEKMVSSGIEGVRKVNRARILLKADQGEFGPGWIDKQISNALDIGIATIERTRKKFINLGLDGALNRKVHNIKTIRRKLDALGEAHLITIACSDPPEDHGHMTLQLIADQLVELGVVESICRETVRQYLKKTRLNHTNSNVG